MRLQPAESLFTTAITQAEILYGVAVLPVGRKRQAIANAVEEMFEEDFRGRILPFDTPAAHFFARIAAQRRGLGRPISQLDAQIAAIAASRGAAVATRNVSDFEHCNIEVLNPWS